MVNFRVTDGMKSRMDVFTTARENFGTVSLSVLTLVLLSFVIHQFNLLDIAWFSTWLLPISAVGSVISILTPQKRRLHFFLFLSIVALTLFHGIYTGAVVFLLAVTLNFALWFSFRKAVLCFACVLMALVVGREGWFGDTSGLVSYPVVGSFLIFRGALLLFERSLALTRESSLVELRMSYLMMLPNAAFLIFPPIGFQRFQNAYDPSFRFEVYLRCLIFLTRGVLNIIIYRVLYQYWAIAITDVADPIGLIRFVTGSYAIAFKISGIMNMAIGVLCLFGFDMPKVFNHFVLAENFSDLWRRINIYWRDLMVELFFNRLFFVFRKLSINARLVFSTFSLFVITAVFHTIQEYWLVGVFKLNIGDFIFWLGFGVLVSAEVLHETTRGRASKKNTSVLALGFRSFLVFCVMSLLWTIWDLPSLSMLGSVISKAWTFHDMDFLKLSAFVLVVVLGIIIIRTVVESNRFKAQNTGITVVLSFFAMLCLWASTMVIPAITDGQGGYAQFMERLIVNPKNDYDRKNQYQGYYDQFFQSKDSLWSTGEDHSYTSPFMTDSSILFSLPRPNLQLPNLKTNSFGMRDKEYSLAKPDSTVRIAALGASYLFGTLYDGEEVWEPILEESLNMDGPCGSGMKYEILNFGNGGYGVIPQLQMTRTKALKFNPDVLLLVSHERSEHFAIFNLFQYLRLGVALEDPYLNNLIMRANVSPEMTEQELHLRLSPYGKELVEWGYNQIAAVCMKNGTRPVWLSFPTTGFTAEDLKRNATYREMAENEGFEVMEEWDIYDGEDVQTLRVSEEDLHLNNVGHRLVADRLFRKFAVKPELLCD